MVGSYFLKKYYEVKLGPFLKKYKVWIERFFVAYLATLVF